MNQRKTAVRVITLPNDQTTDDPGVPITAHPLTTGDDIALYRSKKGRVNLVCVQLALAVKAGILGKDAGYEAQKHSRLLAGKAALSPEMALRIEKDFGPDMDHLLRM